jgi:hypothetical protein
MFNMPLQVQFLLRMLSKCECCYYMDVGAAHIVGDRWAVRGLGLWTVVTSTRKWVFEVK